MKDMLHTLKQIGLIPVVKLRDAADAAPLARALAAGGLPCAEVTFRTPAASEAIRRMADAVPNMIVGAGTVLTPDQADEAADAGARFVVSPGFNPTVVDHCLERGILIIAGINSPTGVEQCLERGLSVVKFFPAEQSGGLALINALAGPYQGVRFIPTGGINPANLTSYTTNPHVLACGGTWMVREKLVDAGRFDEVERTTREAVATMLGLRVAQLSVCTTDEREANTVRLLSELLWGGENVGNACGHVVLSTIDIDRAAAYLERCGLRLAHDTARRCDDGRLEAICLADEVAGFVIELQHVAEQR